ncbi:helix-turn-helix transcriptional regulator [Leuconostoc lactis]
MNRISELRKETNTSQTELAELLGVTRQAISLYEKWPDKGGREPKLETWKKLADYFGVYIGYIQGVSDIRKNDYTGLATSDNDVLLNIIDELYKNDNRADKKLVEYIKSSFSRNVNNSIITMYLLRLVVALFAIDTDNNMEIYEEFAQRLRKLKNDDDSLHIEKLINKRIEQSIRNKEFIDEIEAQNKKASDDKPETEG